MEHLSVIWAATLFVTALSAGFVDTIAGGGGLITIPMLLVAGVPPHVALGTNRLQAGIGELAATTTFYRKKALPLASLKLGVVFTAIGASLGTFLVSQIDGKQLTPIILVLMVTITLYSIFSKSLSQEQGQPRMSEPAYYVLAGLGIGFYNGFFGPGTGSIWMISFTLLLGLDLKAATIRTKPFNFSGNLISMSCFFWLGMVNYRLGLLMGLGQIIGAYLGSGMVMRRGTKLIRPLFITMTSLTTLKLMHDVFVR